MRCLKPALLVDVGPENRTSPRLLKFLNAHCSHIDYDELQVRFVARRGKSAAITMKAKVLNERSMTFVLEAFHPPLETQVLPLVAQTTAPADIVDVWISVKNKQFVPTGLRFTYYPEPVITGVTPLVASIKGGTLLTLTGDHFLDVSATRVRVGCCEVDAVVVDRHTITCKSPKLPSGTHEIQLALNGKTFVPVMIAPSWPPGEAPGVTVSSQSRQGHQCTPRNPAQGLPQGLPISRD